MAKEAEIRSLQLAESGLAACQGMDLILAGLGGIYMGLALAEKLQLPLLQAYLLPFTPTRAFPGVLTPNLPGVLGSAFNPLSHHLARQMMWQSFRTADFKARREALDLPPAPFWGPYRSESLRGMPVLYGFSPSLIPSPVDWSDSIHVTGYWFLDSSEEWTPPVELINFLQAGNPPVYIGFGSMSSKDPAATAELILEALQQIHQRAILLSGWSGLDRVNLPDSILMLDSIPHDWLFPRLAAVVHHGGVGTTAAGLRAGVPSVIIPFFGDQPFWGRLIAQKGLGPQPIPRQQLTANRLANAIQVAVSDGAMRQRAATMGVKIQGEDGIGRAVEIIQKLSK
jgi:UDP:flavonoid glycosyltransferase YjiC (YdhE family)